jgi:hypothetical protein
MRQTAVEWLVNQLNEIGFHTILIEKTIQKAKEMEREQIIEVAMHHRDSVVEVGCIESYIDKHFNNNI